jgi:hypothetical protein
MTQFVIRSMTTTNLPECRRYHVFLLPRLERGGAWWTDSPYRAETFASAADARAELERLGSRAADAQIAPVGAPEFPNYWDADRAEREAEWFRADAVAEEAAIFRGVRLY